MRFPIHFVLLPTGSIGHLVQDYEKVLFQIDQIRQNQRLYVFFMKGDEVSNIYFVQQLEKRHRFLPRIPFIYFHRLFLRLSKAYRQRDLQIDSKSDSVLGRIHASPVPFQVPMRDKSVDDFISKLLFSFGLTKYVCLVARDLGFDGHLARNAFERKKQSMRITPIDFFLPTITFLNELGYMVIRLGRHNESQLESDSNKLAYIEIEEIDSTCTGLADFQVVEGSSFLISTGSGIDCVGLFYRKPLLYVNLLSPSAHPQTHLCPIGLLPNYYLQDRESRLTMEEVLSEPVYSAGTAKLMEMNISLAPKSPHEILDAVKLFVNSFEDSFLYQQKVLLY